MKNWKEDFEVPEDLTEGKIIIKKDLFDYKDKFVEKPIGCNSFVCDLETYIDTKPNSQPITTIISYSHLSYLTKQTVKGRRKPIPYFVEEFEGKVLDIVNDTDKHLTEEDKEIQMYTKLFDDMIDTVKKTSNSLNNQITIFMFNNSRYDNTYFLKVLVRLGYNQTLDDKFHRPIKNQEEIQKYQDRIKELKILLNNEDISSEQKQQLEKEISDNRKFIRKKVVEDKTQYLKEYMLLSNDDVKHLSLKFTYNNYIFELKDMCNFLKTNLKTLGNIIGENKRIDLGEKYYLKDYKTMTPEEWEEYRYYSIIDVKVLWLTGKKYSNLIEFDNSRVLTISSLSLHQWKKLESENKQYYKIDYQDWEIGNESYRGGFSFVNEKFLNKKLHNVHSYDINSSYPSSMMEVIPYEEILESEVDESVKQGKVVKLLNIRFINFKIKEDMIPIIPNIGKNLNNSFYKDYNRELSIKIYNISKKKDTHLWNEFDFWVWEEELEWFKKFYEDLDFEILEVKYFKCKRLFTNYINHFYITKSQCDVDKISVEVIKHYLENRDLKWVEENKKIEFDKYFNEKNNLLSKSIDSYWKDYCYLIDKYIKIVDNLKTDKDIEDFTNDIKTQLIYLDVVRNTTKLYLNTLYGKFGQNPHQETHILLNENYHKDQVIDICINDTTNETYQLQVNCVKQHKVLDKNVYSVVRKDKQLKQSNNVYISSYITMLSRMKLYEVLYRYTNKSVLYGDTDSVKMFDYLDDKYVNNTTLGKWKYEDTYKDFCYVGSKKYMYVNDKGKFDFKISGVNQISTVYGDYKNDKDIQQKILDDFVNYKLKILKKGSIIHKETGEKVIKDKPTEIQLMEKDVDKQFLSTNKTYQDLLDSGIDLNKDDEDYDWSILTNESEKN